MPRVLLQNLSDGKTWLGDAPRPAVGRTGVLIATEASVVSAGTERMLVDFGRASLLGKARSQPQRVAEVIDKARTDGVATTVGAIRNKLNQPITLGYSLAGRVVEVGKDVTHVAVGDRVAAAAPHGELAVAYANLTVPVPDGVDPAHAAFATVGSIALQGIRLAAPTIGERFVVTGLGLVGLLAVQLLIAQGCTVIGIDPNPKRRALAESLGATAIDASSDVLAAAEQLTRGAGVDGVLICASTASSEPVHQAAQMCRKRGRIVLIGVTGLELDRSDFYEKELTFQVSASYGPGRYDDAYEAGGQDYPAGFVRWTAGRNMEAVLDLMGSGKLDVGALVTHEFAFDRAPDAYETLVSDSTALGIVLRYPEQPVEAGTAALHRTIDLTGATAPAARGQIGVIGAGNFATQVLLPAVLASGGSIRTVATSGGTSAALAASKFGAARASSDAADVLDDPAIDTVIVATRHDSHARYVEQALRAGKHVFVEKPLAIDAEELDALQSTIETLAKEGTVPLLGVGFNRRFAPISVRMAELLTTQPSPKALTLTMNAGEIPADHWTQDPQVGGGRIVGEACHLIDLARFLVGHPIIEVRAAYLDARTRDTATITLTFEDGSIATVNYFANGSKRYPKERVEVFSGGRVLINDNFRVMRAYGWPKVRTMRLRSQDKGHRAGMAAFLDGVRRGEAPIPVEELFEVSRAALRAAEPA